MQIMTVKSRRTFGTRPMEALKRQGQGQEAPGLATYLCECLCKRNKNGQLFPKNDGPHLLKKTGLENILFIREIEKTGTTSAIRVPEAWART